MSPDGNIDPGSQFFGYGAGMGSHTLLSGLDGKNIYVGADSSSSITSFPVSVDGSIRLRNGLLGYAGRSMVRGLAVTPDNKKLLIASYPFGDPGILVESLFEDGSSQWEAPGVYSVRDAVVNDIQDIVISTDGRFLYLLEKNRVTIWNIDRGLLNENVGAAVTIASPSSAAVSPDGQYLYVSSKTSNLVYRFQINQSNGALSGGVSAATKQQPIAMAISPDGRHLYVASGQENFVSSFSLSGDGTFANRFDAPTNSPSSSIAISPNNQHLYVSNSSPNETVSSFSVQSDGSLSDRNDVIIAQGSGSGIVPPFKPGSLAISPATGSHARFTSPTAATAGQSVQFDASTSDSSGANITAYSWDFNDGSQVVTTSPRVEHLFRDAGTYTVKLSVQDDSGCVPGKKIFTGKTFLCNISLDQSVVTSGISISAAPNLPLQTVSSQTFCVVPKVLGYSLKKAKAKLASRKCKAGRVRYPRASSSRKKSKKLLVVVGQSQKSGKKLKAGSKINLKLGWKKKVLSKR